MCNFVLAQEGLLGEETEKSSEEVNCIPEDLSVIFDKYSEIENAVSEVPKWYSFGSEYHKNKNYSAAIPILWKVFANDGGKRGNLAIGKIAESYFYENKIDSTLIACYKGLEKFPNDDNQKLHYYAGLLQKELGRSACAIPHYDALVEKNPENLAYLTTLAFLLYKENDNRSIEIQKKVVELSPDDSQAQEALAQYMAASGESPRLAWKDAWEKDNTNYNAGMSYVRYAIEEGYYQDAIGPLSIIISSDPSNKDAYKYRATAYESLGQNNSAISDLESWLNLDPENADIMLSIAVNYSANKKFTTANNWINKAIRKKPGYGKPYIVRGELYEAMVSECTGDKTSLEDKIVYEEAIEVYKMAKKDPIFISVANNKLNNLQNYIRLKEEIFMDPDVKIKNPCYEFLAGSKGVQQ